MLKNIYRKFSISLMTQSLENMIYVIAKLSTFNLEILMTFLLIKFEIKQKI